jgi:hypothetical protein
VSTQARKPGRLTVLRDVTSYIGGWLLIGYQALAVPPRDVNEWFLLLGGSLIGVPGVAEILAWRGRGTGTGAPDGSPPAPDSPRPEPSSSSTT